jgi:hypothetical protein
MEIRRRDNITTLALNRFNEDSRDLFWRNTSFEKILPNPIDASTPTDRIRSLMIRTTVAVGIRHMGDSGNKRRESLLVNDLAGR